MKLRHRESARVQALNHCVWFSQNHSWASPPRPLLLLRDHHHCPPPHTQASHFQLMPMAVAHCTAPCDLPPNRSVPSQLPIKPGPLSSFPKYNCKDQCFPLPSGQNQHGLRGLPGAGAYFLFLFSLATDLLSCHFPPPSVWFPSLILPESLLSCTSSTFGLLLKQAPLSAPLSSVSFT